MAKQNSHSSVIINVLKPRDLRSSLGQVSENYPVTMEEKEDTLELENMNVLGDSTCMENIPPPIPPDPILAKGGKKEQNEVEE